MIFESYKRDSLPLIDALRDGTLPDERGWGLLTEKGYGLAQIAARNDLLPQDFSEWGLTDHYGVPVGHIAFKRGTLPSGFNDWEIRDRMGRTAAHVWVEETPLPPDFDLWTLRDRCGFNVAETACIHRHMPKGITDWQDLIKIAGTPKNVVPPLLPFPFSVDSLCQAPDLKKLPTIRSVSADICEYDDFSINLGNFLDAFYLYRGKEVREHMLKDSPHDTPERWHVPFLGAAAAVLSRRFDLPVPAWTFEPRCFFPDESPYAPESLPGSTGPARDTPPEFVERNVFVSGYVLYRI
ncbi:MAG: hypothetical protein LBQ12_03965 [Deltaproteobacteria bacterium]|nr:hypothetical protein [Deltaproteobacteria bacterium]